MSAKSALFTRRILDVVWRRPTVPSEIFATIDREIGPCDCLSQRESDVAAAFGNGMSHKEVARHLGISPGTVRDHLSAAYAKLGVSNNAELANMLNGSPR